MKKFLSKLGTLFTVLIVIIAICMMLFTVTSTIFFNKIDKAIFGYKTFIVKSDSMAATDFASGDLVLIKEVEPSTLVAGDIMAFTSQDPDSYGEIVTHKIREVSVDGNGDPCFITYGTTTDTNDRTPVTYPYVIGKYVGAIPKVGSFFYFLKTVPGYFVCIFIPFMILIVLQVIDTVKAFRAYKKEQSEAIANERKALEEERLQTRKMLEELEALKAALEEKNKGTGNDQ